MGVVSVSGCGLAKAGSQIVCSSAIALLFLMGLIWTYWSGNKNLFLKCYVALRFF